MKKILSAISAFIITAFFLITMGSIALAQTNSAAVANKTNNEEANQAQPIYVIKVNIPTPIIADRPNLLSISPQFDTKTIKSIRYEWEFGDGNRDSGVEVVHTFRKPGTYNLVVTTKITDLNNKEITLTEINRITVTNRFAILISDKKSLEPKIGKFIQLAEDENVKIQLVDSFNSQSEFLAEEVLAKKLFEIKDVINKTETIIVWSHTGTGLNAIARYLNQDESLTFKNKTIILYVDQLNNLERISRQFNQIGASEIIVVREPGIAINFLENKTIAEYKESLELTGYDYKIINEENSSLKPWRFLSYSLSYLTEKGIPDNILLLILLLPVIVTTIAFLKQVIGIDTLGIYTPAIIALTFLILGLKFGLLVLLFVTIISSLTHKFLKRFRLLYIPKMAIVISIVSLAIFVLFSLGIILNLLDSAFISLAIFPTIVVGTLVEKIINSNNGKNFLKTLLTISEVALVSFIAYIVAGGSLDLYFTTIKFDLIKNIITNFPEVVILTIFINILLGRYIGLRVTEYIHFREIMYNNEE